MKYKCPNCGSLNIVLSEQTVTEKKFKFKKNGSLYKRPFETMHDVADAIYNVECADCFESCNIEDTTEIKRWEINENQD